MAQFVAIGAYSHEVSSCGFWPGGGGPRNNNAQKPNSNNSHWSCWEVFKGRQKYFSVHHIDSDTIRFDFEKKLLKLQGSTR